MKGASCTNRNGKSPWPQFVRQSRKKPVVYVDEKLTPPELAALGKRSKARIVLNNGIGSKPNRPDLVEELIARVGTRLELSRLQKRLELLVAERTASLETANQQLRDELAERIQVREMERCTAIEPLSGGFQIKTQAETGQTRNVYTARRVILAIAT